MSRIFCSVNFSVFTFIGNLPINSGIKPKFINDSSVISSNPTNAPEQINNIFIRFFTYFFMYN